MNFFLNRNHSSSYNTNSIVKEDWIDITRENIYSALVLTNGVKPILINYNNMSIYFDSQSVDLTEKSEQTIQFSFPTYVQSAEVSLKGFTLNYHPKDHDHDDHIACVQLGNPIINGNEVSCTVCVKTPKNAKVLKRNAEVLVTADIE